MSVHEPGPEAGRPPVLLAPSTGLGRATTNVRMAAAAVISLALDIIYTPLAKSPVPPPAGAEDNLPWTLP